MWGHCEKMALCERGESLHQILDLPAPWHCPSESTLWENIVYCLSLPFPDISLQQLELSIWIYNDLNSWRKGEVSFFWFRFNTLPFPQHTPTYGSPQVMEETEAREMWLKFNLLQLAAHCRSPRHAECDLAQGTHGCLNALMVTF